MCMQPEPAECMPARAVLYCCSEQGLVVTLVQGLLLQAHPQTLHPAACAEDQVLGKLHQAVCILGLQLFCKPSGLRTSTRTTARMCSGDPRGC